MHKQITVLGWTAVVSVAALLVLMAVLSKQKGDGKLAYDWPFIGAYTLLFLCIAVMYAMRGEVVPATSIAAAVMATAVFDTIENLTIPFVVSKPKWFFFFVCVLLTVPLFLPVKSWLARVIVGLLLIAGLAGIVATLLMKAGLQQATLYVLGTSGIAILAFLLAAWIFARTPQVLLPSNGAS